MKRRSFSFPLASMPVFPTITILVAFFLMLSGCAGRIVLNHVAVGDVQENQLPTLQMAEQSDWKNVQIIRQEQQVQASPGMPLMPGDKIATLGKMVVTIDFQGATSVYVLPESRVTILNPNISLISGWILIQKIRGLFEVDTENITAGSPGTEYLVRSDRGNEQVTVLSGRVSLLSKSGRWQTMFLEGRQQAEITESAPPQVCPLKPEEYKQLREWSGSLIKFFDNYSQEPPPKETPPSSNGGPSLWEAIGVATDIGAKILEAIPPSQKSSPTPAPAPTSVGTSSPAPDPGMKPLGPVEPTNPAPP